MLACDLRSGVCRLVARLGRRWPLQQRLARPTWHAACSHSGMDIASSVAASRLVAQQRVMDVVAVNIANANTPGFKAERVQFSDWLTRLHGTRCAARRPHHRLHAGPRDLARAARGHADAHRQSVRPRHHRRRLLHRPHAARAAADARRPVRPDAGRHRGGRRRQCVAGQQRTSRSCCRPPTRRSPSPATAPISSENGQLAQDRRGAADRSDAARGRGQHAVPLRLADRRR